MLLAWFGSVESLGVVATIEGKVNLPSASLVVNTFPACAATVSVVSAVKLTNDVLPADINPANDLTGPENVDLAMFFLLTKYVTPSWSKSAESVGITNYLGMRLSYQKKIEMCRKDKVAGLSKKPPAGFH